LSFAVPAVPAIGSVNQKWLLVIKNFINPILQRHNTPLKKNNSNHPTSLFPYEPSTTPPVFCLIGVTLHTKKMNS
jgi:hypothetical protein